MKSLRTRVEAGEKEEQPWRHRSEAKDAGEDQSEDRSILQAWGEEGVFTEASAPASPISSFSC